MTLTEVLTDLEVLSMIKEKDKLCIRDGHITIEQKTHPFKIAIRRWIKNDNRRTMIMEINNVISLSLQLCKDAKENPEKKWTLGQFNKHFKKVIEGLENLKKTYFNDSNVVARLTILNEILKEEINQLESNLTSTSCHNAISN